MNDNTNWFGTYHDPRFDPDHENIDGEPLDELKPNAIKRMGKATDMAVSEPDKR